MQEQLPLEIMQKAAKGIGYIAHPLRLRILEFLDVNGASSVSALSKGVGEEQVIVSQSLKKMRDAHLVKTQRKGIFIYYSVNEEYPASIFVCLRKLFGYMTNNFYFLQDNYKVILPRDYTTMAANRIKSFAHFEKMRILEFLYLNSPTSVNALAKGTGLSSLKVSQLLKLLKEDELVAAERKGKFVFYRLLKGVQETTIACIRKRYNSLGNKKDF